MNESFRRRVFTPLVMPLTLLGAVLIFALATGRILLAVSKTNSVLVAVLLAAYIMVVAFVVERAENLSAPAIATGLVLGFVGIVGGGALAAQAGIRPIEEHGAEGEEGGGEAVVAEIPEGALTWVTDSTNLEYTDAPGSGTAGTATLAIDNPTGTEHNVVIEGFQNDAVLVEATNGIDAAELEIEAGTYTYYCSIAGHRTAMEQ